MHLPLRRPFESMFCVHIVKMLLQYVKIPGWFYVKFKKEKKNQRDNGPVNVHLISGPRISR